MALLYEGRESVDNYDPIRTSVIDRLKDMAARTDLRRLASRSQSRIQKVLDYGTGNGRFALVSSELWPDASVDAVDFSPSPPPALKEPCRRVRYMHVEEYERETAQYDLIVLRHVLEHVHDPVGLLRSFAGRLSRQGVLYVEVPNVHSAYIHRFGVRTNAYAVPFHLTHFSSGSFRWSLRKPDSYRPFARRRCR